MVVQARSGSFSILPQENTPYCVHPHCIHRESTPLPPPPPFHHFEVPLQSVGLLNDPLTSYLYLS